MAKLNKRMRSAHFLDKWHSLFMCPLCQTKFSMEKASLVCHNNHTFDIAKQGYVNLLNLTANTNYDKSLFLARRKIIQETNLFEPLHESIVNVIKENIHPIPNEQPLIILDAGCGEGSHLVQIRNNLTKIEQSTVGIGIDIAKEGILEATKSHANNIWFVADLANLPFMNEKIDIILNILSPANYEQFNRVLTEKGFVIKVAPRQNYLKELRDYFPDKQKKRTTRMKKIIQLFSNRHHVISKETVHYQVALSDDEWNSLIQMTPLTWNLSTSSIQQFLQSGINTITVDFDIIVGKKMR